RGGKWWRTLGLLLLAMVLLGSAISLWTEGWGSLPASLGGLSGLLGAGAIRALAGRLPEAAQFWTVLGAGAACLFAGTALAARVFAFDWARLMTLPQMLRRAPALTHPNPFKPQSRSDRERRAAKFEPLAEDDGAPPRRAPEITDPSQPPRPARPAGKARQKDLFENYQLPSLDLLADPPADNAPKLDKLALERNARLLENVLDDFNVKGEITAVRTGPVVTMYELEPAPGIKASRVIGLAEDIARN